MKTVDVSAIVAAKNDHLTLSRSLDYLYRALVFTGKNYEIIVICADEKSFTIAKDKQTSIKNLQVYKDQTKGKPSAINQALKLAKGDFIVFTDGDVYIKKKKGLKLLLDPFYNDSRVGLVAGMPKAINTRSEMIGYWGYILTKMAHFERKRKFCESKYFSPAGWLYATLRKVTPKIPSYILADDHYISSYIHSRGYKLFYQPEAKVEYKTPTNLKDFFYQKIRTLAGTYQSQKMFKNIKQKRNVFMEIRFGFIYLNKVINPTRFSWKLARRIWWTFLLYIVRLITWLTAYLKYYLNRKNPLNLWIEVKSTKKL